LKEKVRGFIPLGADARYSLGMSLCIVVAVAFVLRMIVVLFVFRIVAAPTLDHNEFGWEMGWTARSIVLGRGFSSPFFPLTGPTALVPPLYPYLLAGIQKIFGLYSASSALVILSLNSLLSALTVVPIYFSAKHALNARIAKFAAVGWAIYPFSIYFAADRVWDYALTALLLSLCFWAAQKMHLRSTWAWLGFGALCGVATMSNPSVLTVLLFPVLLVLWKVRRVSGPWIFKGAVALLGFVVVCSPWLIRNQRVMHQNALLRDGFWLEFWAGNNGDTSESNSRWAHPASNPVEMQKYEATTELDYIAQKRALAFDFVEHHPGFFVVASVRRVIRFWTGFWSFSREYLALEPTDIPNFFFCGVLTLLLLRGAVRWWKEDRGSALPYLAAMLLFPIPYYLTHSSMDYRQPIEPLVVVLVVVGIWGAEDRAEPFVVVDEPCEEAEPELIAI
jgi:4-amino-4-deoxy-L-arabinose transferase-like glycosyltransferase